MPDRPPAQSNASKKKTQGDEPQSARLRRVLLHEKKLGYTDSAVYGGLDELITTLATSISWLKGMAPLAGRTYASLSQAERSEWIGAVLRRLTEASPGAPGRSGRQTSGRAHNGSSANQAKKAEREPSITPPDRLRSRGSEGPAGVPPEHALPLGTAVSGLPFVTKAQADRLRRMEVNTLRDLVWLFPNRHIDYSKAFKIHQLEEGQEATVVGRVTTAEPVQIGGPPGAARITINDSTGLLVATFFRQSYLVQKFQPGTVLALSGRVYAFRNRAHMDNPEYDVFSTGAAQLVHAGNLLPVYPSTEGLQQRSLRTIARKALDAALPLVKERIPEAILRRHGMPGLARALEDMHFPATAADREAARRRLAFDELLVNQLVMLKRRQEWRERGGGAAIASAEQLVKSFVTALPYSLTAGQASALREILESMSTDEPMARLLQGEVGSGKTVVALAALLATVGAGYQGALLAPTEILAEQHFLSTCRQLGAAPVFGMPELVRAASLPGTDRQVHLALLTGSLTVPAKAQVQALVSAGRVDVVIGTHALLQDAVEFPRLGLAVVDEQHRFGVEQRAALVARRPRPHLLAMSATPIPRTLNMTVYGDFDVSTLRELPGGRKPIASRWARTTDDRGLAYDLIRREVGSGRQAFIVCPLIEPSEEIKARAAVPEFERLRRDNSPLAGLRTGLLHGRMSLAAKQEAMDRMRTGEIDVLVATPVIEVGVDVPNATVMVVESAGRFGLAQLHQLRGRVGRGPHSSHFIMLSDDPSEEARERLSAVERLTDGFELAEEDLRLRGPGEYVGTRQSGWANLKVANFSDVDLLVLARREASDLLRSDSALSAPAHAPLAREVTRIMSGYASEMA